MKINISEAMAEVAERQHMCIQITWKVAQYNGLVFNGKEIQSTNVPEDLSSGIIEDDGSEARLSSTLVSFPSAVENMVKSHSGSRIRDA